MLDVSQLNLAQQIAATVIAGGAVVLSIKALMTYYNHLPIKYGKPEADGSPPPVPKDQSGSASHFAMSPLCDIRH
eukprot:1338707-Rhodomonas_salina.5